MKIENASDLRVLIQTARTGSLTAAAAALSITPAAASAMLKRLEVQLGARLFERSTRAMRLTSQGQTLLDYTHRAFDLLKEAESQLTHAGKALVGTIRIAAPSDLTRTVLLPWFSEFMTSHPDLSLLLTVGDKPRDLMRDEVDMAVRYGALSDSALVARPLKTAKLVLCAAPGYLQNHPVPMRPQDLLDHNCLIFERAGKRNEIWRFAQRSQWTEVRVKGDRCVDDASLARQWAIAGAGLTLKSNIDVQSDLKSGALVPLLKDWQTETYPLNALLPSGRFVPQRVRALVDFLVMKFSTLELS